MVSDGFFVAAVVAGWAVGVAALCWSLLCVVSWLAVLLVMASVPIASVVPMDLVLTAFGVDCFVELLSVAFAAVFAVLAALALA